MLALTLLSALTGTPSSGISIGIVIGDPTGLSLKFWGIGQNSALQVNIGGGGFVAPADLSVSGSLLFHALLTRETPINGYLGVGALAGINQGRRGDKAVFGILVPLGLELILSEVPLDLFIEVPPLIGFTTDGDVRAGLTFGIGLRFILK
ncbi:MAG: hypothetical protein ACO2OT_05940 [Candidatus Caldipriscus sp.]|jgi:hypothetical protein